MKKKSDVLKSHLSHSKNFFELRISCGDFYLREDISWDEDARYCRDLLDVEFEHLDEKIETFKVFMEYTAPEEEDIKLIKKNKLSSYEINEDVHLFNVIIFDFDQKEKTLRICDDFWMGNENLVIKIIKSLKNLKKITFEGRNFKNKKNGMSLADDGMDDELIRHHYNNNSWEDEMFLDPAEDKDDLEQLVRLKKEIGSDVEIDFNFLSDASLDLLKKINFFKDETTIYDYILTKTLIKSGLQCQKKLWLDFHEPEKEDNNTSIYSGNIFGKKLRELDKSGLDLSKLQNEEALEETKKALKSKECKIIYEGAFIFHDTLIRPDVLKRSKDGWELWEAKAVKVEDETPENIKEIFIKDIAIQYYIVSSCDVNITNAKLVCIDDKFIYQGDKNYKNLIKEIDVTEFVKQKSKEVYQDIENFKPLASTSTDCPDCPIGKQCNDPYPCIYIPSCEAELEKNDLVDYKVLPNIRKKELKNYIEENNITTNIQDIPSNLLNDQQKIIRDCHLKNTEYFHPELKNILSKYEWPFYFMDFETIQQFVPIIKETKSHEVLPFQWSVHKWVSIEKNLKVDEGSYFLDFAAADIESKFVESLLKALEKKGSIFVHNQSTEINV